MLTTFIVKHLFCVEFGRNHGKSIATTILGLLILSLVIGGCTMVGPDYVKPAAPEQEQWLESEDPKIKSKEADFSDWWTVFSDPVLNELIQAAYQQNLPLQIAGLRIYEARAQLGIAFGFQYPQTQQGLGSASLNQVSKNAPNVAAADRYYSVYDIGLDAAWELDVWGKFRRSVQTGVASLEASIADYDDILVSLTSEVARTYIVLRTSEERLAVARQNVEIQKRSLEIAEIRFNAGAVTELDVTQAKSLLRSTEATIPGFETDIRQAKNALAILLGKLPGEIDARLGSPGLIPEIPAQVAVGIPTELLRRRPDIRFAERQLAAQSAQIGFAKADLFPHFSLFGTWGFQTGDYTDNRSNNSKTRNLFDKDSINYSVGAGFNWDLFNYGRITNQVRVEDARFQELAVNYEDTVLRAAQEVEDAMVGFLQTQDAVFFLADAVKAAKRSVDLSLIQYREGLVDYQRVLDTQRDLTTQQDNLVFTAGSVNQNLIAMYRALGGGWEIRAGNDFIPASLKEQMERRTNWGTILSPQKTEYPPSQDVKSIFHKPDW
ncbi:MAG: efflux transporter outer membrane subunit [Deltaproteobacteria bacterium]|jgi:NodT family efflux transporter outer membrane factor (OMF) lipoprotein|nr:efflux transporter outer membrane subunit [Deltaproteobacteria bacterium]